jgi:ribonucleoside-diphosphate reductase beta chain
MTREKYSIFPLDYPDLFEKFKKVEAQSWKADICDFSKDDWDSLDESQKNALKMLIFFFANADAIVADNLALNFLQEDIPEEAKFFYSYQLHNENVHNETYAKIIEAYIKDPDEKLKAYNSIKTIPTVSKKMSWAQKWITNGTFEEKLIAFACVEGLLFSSTFATIFWFKALQKPLWGLYTANEEISTDENSHYDFNVYFYNNYISNKLEPEKVRSIILEAYEVEKQYVEDVFGPGINGMNKEKMLQYIQFITDNILSNFKLEVEFNVTNPIKFTEQIAIPIRENFFEGRNTQYTSLTNSKIEFDEDLDF